MLEQIQEIVRKNLPAEVGEQLRQYMNEAENQKKFLGYANERIKAFELSVTAKDSEIKVLNEKLKLAGDLDQREKLLTKAENRLEVTLAQNGYHAAVERANEIKDLVCLVFKNPRIVKSAMTTEQVPMVVPGQSYPTTSTKTQSETKSKEVNP